MNINDLNDFDSIMILIQALKQLNSNEKHSDIKDATYEGIIWNENAVNIPTKKDVETTIQNLINQRPLILLREERDNKLKESDIYGLSDFPFANDTIKQAWITYRQELRDLPSTTTPQLDENGELTNVTWPTPPS